jgi:hypothetical protein
LSTFFGRNAAYGAVMVTRPQTIGYSLSDSPSGLAAWIYEKFAQWSDSEGIPERVFSRDEMLNDITLYWLTNTGASSSRFYWENNNNNFSSDAQKTKGDLPGAGELEQGGLSHAALLPPCRYGRSLRRLGTAPAFR